jgi:Transglycosylase SLT domain
VGRKAAAERAKRAEEEASRKRRAAASPTTKPPSFGPIPASCKEYSGNRAIGCALMLDAGFGLDQMPCLEKLWTKESGWNPKASNPSGAYGIPQALPGSKMGAYGDDWETNPATQIKWGLSYIKGRYDTPCGAWQHFLDVGWY